MNPLLITKVAGIQCDAATLEAAIAEAERDMALFDNISSRCGDWFPNPDCMLPLEHDDVEE